MSFTFRRWLSWQNRPSRPDGTVHGPSFLRRLSELVTEPWDSPATLLGHLGPDEEWPAELTADARKLYNRAFRQAVGPRNGPHTGRGSAIWTRVIGGHHYLFWAWHDRLDVHLVPEDGSPQLIHTYPKETP
ncbi:hypothetical protein [Kitasatospora sp. NPDC127116]|uniref:hypothetical protein n=1 Tax=Kitasatospora sp. NPDC127116 TaxID=3345367 RepID=UPI0036441F65